MTTLAGFCRIHFLTLANDLSLSFLVAASFSFTNQVIAAVIWRAISLASLEVAMIISCEVEQMPEITGTTLVLDLSQAR